MPLEPLNFTILKKVVPPTLLRNQTPVCNQLPDPHCRYPEDLSALFRSDQAHLAQSLTLCSEINQRDSTRKGKTTQRRSTRMQRGTRPRQPPNPNYCTSIQ